MVQTLGKTAEGGTPPWLEEVVRPLNSQAALAEASRCLYCYNAPCSEACPAGIGVPDFIRKISTGNMKGATRVILQANILGATCARVCPVDKLCEGACVLGKVERPVAIGRLQRFVTDWAAEKKVSVVQRGQPVGKQVAVVGAGPAGLACATELLKMGYSVTIFEAREKGGGLDTYGIVPFRLPTELSLAEVSVVEGLGAEIRTETAVGRDVPVEALLENYDAVFVGVGLGKGQPLGIRGEELAGVYDALDLLEAVKCGQVDRFALGTTVAVIGGGNTAIDAATTAKRLGAEEVMVLYRRSEQEMPAYRAELDFARLEGVHLHWLTAPTSILGETRVEGLECVKMRLGEPDESGRRRPLPIPGSEYRIKADTVIKAVGQVPVAGIADLLGVKSENGLITVDPETGSTSNGRIFAGGDCVTGGGEVVYAVQAGKRAAKGIDKLLRG